MKYRNGSLWPWLRGFKRSHCERPIMGPIIKPWDGRKKKSSSSDDWLDFLVLQGTFGSMGYYCVINLDKQLTQLNI